MNNIYCRSAAVSDVFPKGLLVGLFSILFVFPGQAQESQSGIDALMDEIVVTARKKGGKCPEYAYRGFRVQW